MAGPGPVAALDCGTNSTRLLVVDGAGRTLERSMRITRLGQGVDAVRKLAPDAVERTLAVLAEYAARLEARGVTAARLVATSAVRDAVNGAEFLRAAEDVTGVRAELLTGEEEGRLSYAGATAELPPPGGPDLVVDIGGGSTELVVGPDPVAAVSLDLGCVRLTERRLPTDPPTPAEWEAARAAVDEALDGADRARPALAALPGGARLVGLAGTVSTLAQLELGLPRYDRDRIHHAVLTRAAVDGWAATLAAEPAALRARRPGMAPGREDVIAGGALILSRVMAHYGLPRCLVSESDILDGLVASLRGRG
jgi:exopolyphosphatase/guanosine-5'-triphosphate,3'-diphosphate pyrophosphatase